MKCLMCFVCGCKYLFHIGYDKFGCEVSKGEINYRTSIAKILRLMLHRDGDDKYDEAWKFNLSCKRFKDHFGAAVNMDETLADGVWEWRRQVHRDADVDEAICNPEDVERTAACQHEDDTVCSHCRIPICNEC